MTDLEELHRDLIGEFDAMKWATAFVRTVQEHPQIPTDVGAMVGWFANAIMAGYDAHRAEEAAKAKATRAGEVGWNALGSERLRESEEDDDASTEEDYRPIHDAYDDLCLPNAARAVPDPDRPEPEGTAESDEDPQPGRAEGRTIHGRRAGRYGRRLDGNTGAGFTPREAQVLARALEILAERVR